MPCSTNDIPFVAFQSREKERKEKGKDLGTSPKLFFLLSRLIYLKTFFPPKFLPVSSPQEYEWQ